MAAHQEIKKEKEVSFGRQGGAQFVGYAWDRGLEILPSELHRNPMLPVVEVLVVAADALDRAKAALLRR